ncbi:MAG: amidohydrolase [Clostridia bacterium]|nr:amidohydrolase [Clostridia bacterium]MBQ2272420.1 amidohydrolase [Clostridia bacterium]
MIIDFHTHIFPDKIAKKTIDFLAAKGNVTPYSDGSVNGLLNEMEKGNADLAIALPVLTNPMQFDSVNRFAAEVNRTFGDQKRKIVSFGGIHPKCEDIDGKMKFLKEQGFSGVKIHPDYQETFINDEGYLRILNCAKEYDLTVVTHAGIDIGYRDQPVRCPPQLAKEVIRAVGHPKLVLAHYGASEQWDEVYDLLCGEDVYFDTAFCLRFIDREQFCRILEKHGADKILFATDSPWGSIREDAEILRSFNLGDEITDKIFYKNALTLL